MQLPFWPFVVASLAFGCFATGFYLLLYQRPKDTIQRYMMQRSLGFWEKVAESRWLPLLFTFGAFYGAAIGVLQVTSFKQDFAAYAEAFASLRIVYASTIDFTLFCVILIYWMRKDAATRGFSIGLATVLGCIPVVGPVAYLWFRPRLPSKVQW